LVALQDAHEVLLQRLARRRVRDGAPRVTFRDRARRFGEAFQRIQAGEGKKAVAHATGGPCLQQNLVAVLEGSK